jgi:hypothetical protein
MKIFTKKLNLGILLVLFLCGCTDEKITFNFPLDPDGPAEIPSKIDVCKARETLFSSSLHVPKSPDWKYWLLFDGVLIESHALQNQKQEISVKITKILAGSKEYSSKKISIILPEERFGGVPIAIGEKYRVLAVRLGKKYYSWAALGTAPKNPAFSGFYDCDK